MLPATTERVSSHSSDSSNRQIAQDTAERLGYFAAHPAGIPARLRELDHEWDVERTLEANASTLALTGTVLAVTVDRRWLALPMLVLAFLLQHALLGWCPPLPILRRLGFRTTSEIGHERYALKALRGDFNNVASASDKGATALRAARA